MEAAGGSSAISTSFGFLAGEECTLQQSQGLVRLLKFSRDAFDERDVIVIAGLNRWTILTNSAGRELYELKYRFDGDQFTVRSFIEL